jgi:hypothetical protein
MMCDDWVLHHELFKYLCYFDMIYIHWHCLAKKNVCNKVHMNEYQYEIQYGLHFKVVYITCISSIL